MHTCVYVLSNLLLSTTVDAFISNNLPGYRLSKENIKRQKQGKFSKIKQMEEYDLKAPELGEASGKLLDDSRDRKLDKEGVQVEVENYVEKALIYGVNDSPPIHITVVCGLQVSIHFVFYSMYCEKCLEKENDLENVTNGKNISWNHS